VCNRHTFDQIGSDQIWTSVEQVHGVLKRGAQGGKISRVVACDTVQAHTPPLYIIHFLSAVSQQRHVRGMIVQREHTLGRMAMGTSCEEHHPSH
jgi:hypothetical protein